MFVLFLSLSLSPSAGLCQEDPPPVETDPEKAEPSIQDDAPRETSVADAAKPLPPGYDSSLVADKEASLKVWNRPIVVLRAHVGGLDPQERAQRVAELITSLPDEFLDKEVWTEPSVIRGANFQLIGVQNQVLLGLLREDLLPTSNQTLDEVATQVASRIQGVIRAKAEQNHLPNLLRGIGLSLLVTVVFGLLLAGIFRLRHRLITKLSGALGRRSVGVSGFDLKPYLQGVMHRAVGPISWALILPLAYLWLTFVFKRFPFTRPWGVGLGNYLVDLLTDLSIGFLSAVPGLFTVFLIFLFNRFLTRIVGAFFLSVESEALHVSWLQPETAKATRRLIIVVMWIFALTVAYPYIPGSSTAAFKGVSVFVGLMVSLGATGLVNQIVSGMVIVYTRAFRPGEFVRIDETEGTVEEIGVLSTKLSTLRREHVTIPNAVLIGTKVNNYSRDAAEQGNVIATSVTIGYDAPWRQIHALLKLSASRCADIRQDPEPRVLQKSLTDFYVEYTLLANINEPRDRYIILSELHGHIQDVFNEHDVQIMSPHYLDQATEPVVVARENWSPPPADPGDT